MKKLVDGLYRFSHVLEVIMGLFVLVAIIINGITVMQEFGTFWSDRMTEGAFMGFLEQVLNLVIGVEFLKMLLRPNTDTILEVLVFVIARHMVVKTTTSLEDLLSVVSVGVLLMIRKHFGNQPITGETEDKEPIVEKEQ